MQITKGTAVATLRRVAQMSILSLVAVSCSGNYNNPDLPITKWFGSGDVRPLAALAQDIRKMETAKCTLLYAEQGWPAAVFQMKQINPKCDLREVFCLTFRVSESSIDSQHWGYLFATEQNAVLVVVGSDGILGVYNCGEVVLSGALDGSLLRKGRTRDPQCHFVALPDVGSKGFKSVRVKKDIAINLNASEHEFSLLPILDVTANLEPFKIPDTPERKFLASLYGDWQSLEAANLSPITLLNGEVVPERGLNFGVYRSVFSDSYGIQYTETTGRGNTFFGGRNEAISIVFQSGKWRSFLLRAGDACFDESALVRLIPSKSKKDNEGRTQGGTVPD